MRIVLAALVGGFVMFFWGFVCHVVLPFGTLDVHQFAHEDAAIAALKEQAGSESGIYLYPGLDMRKDSKPEEEQAWIAKYMTGPVGIVVYRAGGGDPMLGTFLVKELASNIAAALVAAWLLTRISGSFFVRASALGAVGLIAWLSISVSYWNWYAFPPGFIGGELFEQFFGWFLSGLAMAKIVKVRAA